MACANPITIKNPNFKPAYTHYYAFGNIKSWKQYLEVPCGHCINCLVDKRNSLEDRCNYEYKKFGSGAFVTFTYDDVHLFPLMRKRFLKPDVATLSRKDCSDFIKRLKITIKRSGINNKYINPNFSYIIVGEYGHKPKKQSIFAKNKFNRPHFHALFFGLDFNVAKPFFNQTWQNGIVDSLPILNGGIRYVLKYLDKQLYGEEAKKKYDNNGIERPFMSHSVNFGTGLYLDNMKFIKEHNYCYLTKHNKLRPIPPYYKNKMLGQSITDNSSFYAKMKEYNIKTDKEVNGKKTYSLKALNEFKHKQALIREQNLVEMSRRDGTPISKSSYQYDDFHPTDKSFYDLPKIALDWASIPF